MDINFDWNFWSILFLTLGYILGSFMKGVGKSNQQDQLIRDLAQLQANNRDLEIQNDKLNQTLFESTKENQRLINQLEQIKYTYQANTSPMIRPPFISTSDPIYLREEGQIPWQTIEE